MERIRGKKKKNVRTRASIKVGFPDEHNVDISDGLPDALGPKTCRTCNGPLGCPWAIGATCSSVSVKGTIIGRSCKKIKIGREPGEESKIGSHEGRGNLGKKIGGIAKKLRFP
jgi:hypothetical protein